VIHFGVFEQSEYLASRRVTVPCAKARPVRPGLSRMTRIEFENSLESEASAARSTILAPGVCWFNAQQGAVTRAPPESVQPSRRQGSDPFVGRREVHIVMAGLQPGVAPIWHLPDLN